MKKIELLPKWYDDEETKQKDAFFKENIKELLQCDKLPAVAIDELSNLAPSLKAIKGVYSRNYEIKIVNKWIDYYNRQEVK